MTRSRIVLATVAGLLAVTAGCSATTPPGEAVPALRTELSRVDAALAGGDYADARSALDALASEAGTARDAGRLTTEQANRILAAVARLTADLPAQSPVPQPTSTVEAPAETPMPQPTVTPRSRSTPAIRAGKPDGDKQKQHEDKKKDKKDEKEEGGDGHNSGNGPDDGHGN